MIKKRSIPLLLLLTFSNFTHAGHRVAIFVNAAGGLVMANECPTVTIIPSGSTNTCAGSIVGLFASSSPGVTYQWQMNGTNIIGATNSTYTVTQTGTYTVVVSNGTCSVTSAPITITINQPTTITTQPQSQNLCFGGNAVLSVVATGTNLTYQWKKDGVNINGATASSYAINNAAGINSGSYSVIVNGNCGSEVSNIAAITVNACTGTLQVEAAIQAAQLVPTIVIDNAILKLTSKKTMSVNIEVIDVRGRVVKHFYRQMSRGANEVSLFFGEVGEGVYLVSVNGVAIRILKVVSF